MGQFLDRANEARDDQHVCLLRHEAPDDARENQFVVSATSSQTGHASKAPSFVVEGRQELVAFPFVRCPFNIFRIEKNAASDRNRSRCPRRSIPSTKPGHACGQFRRLLQQGRDPRFFTPRRTRLGCHGEAAGCADSIEGLKGRGVQILE